MIYYLIGYICSLLRSRDFWKEYLFYICYLALLGFIIQVVLLDVEIYDYLAVLGLQLCSLFASALIFVGLKMYYQPSNYRKKLGYFVIANGPWLGLIYHAIHGMAIVDLLVYGCLMFMIALLEGHFYDVLFDNCCHWIYRFKMICKKSKHRH